MAGFNKVILLGNLTRDPQLKYLPNNTAVCEFGLAANRKWRDKDGNMRDDVCFVDISAFGRQGETINQYMTKGSAILIEGRLKLEQWTAQDGSKRSKLSVVAENFQFTGSRGGGGPQGGQDAGYSGRDAGGQGGRDTGGQGGREAGAHGGRDGGQAGPQGRYDEAIDAPAPSGDDIPF